MSSIQLNVLFTGLFFLFIFATGFWVSHTGKPYPTLKINVHKLISLGAVAFIIITLNKIHKVAPLSPVQILAIVINAILFVATIVTGGLASLEKSVAEPLRKVHHVAPYLTIISTAASLFLLYKSVL